MERFGKVQIFFSVQVTGNVIIITKCCRYELIYVLPNNLTIRILANWKRSAKSQIMT